MGFRFRKSVKIAPGVRLNLGSKSGSVSFGGKGITYNTKLYGGKKKKKSDGGPSVVGPVLYWAFIGWWWWPTRLICYDLPKFIIKKLKDAKKPEA